MAENGESSLAELRAFMLTLEGESMSEATVKAMSRVAGWASVVRACAVEDMVPTWPEGEAGDRAREAFQALLDQQAQLERLLELTRSG